MEIRMSAARLSCGVVSGIFRVNLSHNTWITCCDKSPLCISCPIWSTHNTAQPALTCTLHQLPHLVNTQHSTTSINICTASGQHTTQPVLPHLINNTTQPALYQLSHLVNTQHSTTSVNICTASGQHTTQPALYQLSHLVSTQHNQCYISCPIWSANNTNQRCISRPTWSATQQC